MNKTQKIQTASLIASGIVNRNDMSLEHDQLETVAEKSVELLKLIIDEVEKHEDVL